MACEAPYRFQWATTAKEMTTRPDVTPSCEKCGTVMTWEHKGGSKYWRWRCARCRFLSAAHGLTAADYDQLVTAQDGSCAICGTTGDLVIDHDHSCCKDGKSCTQCRRGLLCNACNRMLGFGKDDVRIIASAVSYLLGSRLSAD